MSSGSSWQGLLAHTPCSLQPKTRVSFNRRILVCLSTTLLTGISSFLPNPPSPKLTGLKDGEGAGGMIPPPGRTEESLGTWLFIISAAPLSLGSRPVARRALFEALSALIRLQQQCSQIGVLWLLQRQDGPGLWSSPRLEGHPLPVPRSPQQADATRTHTHTHTHTPFYATNTQMHPLRPRERESRDCPVAWHWCL